MSKPVVLVNPGRHKILASTHPPMNLGYIASYLEKHGVEVYIVDELAGQNVEEALEKLRPEIVGITATTPLVPDAYRVAGISRNMGILTVMGGVHASVLPEEALEHVDIVVIGEGERGMLDVVMGERSRIISSPYIKNLDEIPSPAWHLMDMEYYLYSKDRFPHTHLFFVPLKTRTASLITIRGCPYSCIFCHNSWRGLPVRFHSPERVISDIKFLVDRYNIQALYFMDDDLFVYKDRLKNICQLMEKEKIDLIWGAQATANHVDIDILKVAKNAGCRQIGFGFESGSQRILEILKSEKISIEQNAQAARLCKEVGILSWATFMIGNPTETIEDIQATFQFIKDNHIDGVGIHMTTPFPGTQLWQWCEERNLIPKKIDWSKFTTGEISILACDTILPETIVRLTQEIQNYLHPRTFLTIFPWYLQYFRSPKLFYQAIIHRIKR